MKSFNHHFNTCCMRVSFWEKLAAILAKAEKLSREQGHLTPEDVRVLKIVRRAIKDSYKRSKTAEEHHSRQLKQLRREYLNGRRTTNESCKH